MAATGKRYGWAGLGQMGEAMTTNLLAAGLDLTVWNRTAAKCDPIKALGAKVAEAPKELFEACDIVFVMLSTPEAARAWWAENAQYAKDKIIVDCATLGSETMIHIGGLVVAAGGHFVEAPVAGHSGMAKAKTIDFLCSGNKAAFDECSEAMTAMSKGQHFFGEELGKASAMKLVVNSTLGNMMSCLAEGLAVTEKVGLSKEQYLAIIGNHPMLSSGLFKTMGQRILDGNHDPLFMTKHELKDLGLAVDMAAAAGQAMPVATTSMALHKKACDEGHSEKHHSAVYLALAGQAP